MGVYGFWCKYTTQSIVSCLFSNTPDWNLRHLLSLGYYWSGQGGQFGSITTISLYMGRPPSAELRYGEKDNISPSTLIFATRKG